MNKKKFLKDISYLTSIFIELGISLEQNFPSVSGNLLYISGDFDHGISLRNIDYKDIYLTLSEQKNFNCKFLDGALLQLMYSFDTDDNLLKHRLCYFPSPHLLAYDENFEYYEEDVLYADMIMKNILPIPIRFDFESDEKKFKEISHPYSHLTLGQHKNCRIPLSQPLTPFCFMSFIVRNFYNSHYEIFMSKCTGIEKNSFARCISKTEETILHVNIL